MQSYGISSKCYTVVIFYSWCKNCQYVNYIIANFKILSLKNPKILDSHLKLCKIPQLHSQAIGANPSSCFGMGVLVIGKLVSCVAHDKCNQRGALLLCQIVIYVSDGSHPWLSSRALVWPVLLHAQKLQQGWGVSGGGLGVGLGLQQPRFLTLPCGGSLLGIQWTCSSWPTVASVSAHNSLNATLWLLM